jgi:hypothetical protein
MMRTILGFAALLCLFGFLARVSDAQAPQVPGKQGPVGWPHEVKGYGATVEKAKDSAMTHAVQRITACLESQDPPLQAWHPDELYVKKHLLKGAGEQGDDFALADNGLKVKTWILHFQEPTKWHEMVQLNQAEVRRQSSAERQSTAAIGLAGLTALLVVGWGYLRVDEWTKGRFSRWLAIGAVTVLGASGAVWWMNT